MTAPRRIRDESHADDFSASKEFSTEANGIRLDINVDCILEVRRSTKAFASGAHSLIDAPAGSLFAVIQGATPAPKAYSTVQIGPTEHVELNSKLVYCNHSCAPAVEFDVAKMEVRVVKNKDLKVGDPITFFYPSSEWEMAQPFKCNCGAKECWGWISGAKDMDENVLKRYWLNEHIEKLLHQRAIQQHVVNGTTG
jgi:hypothetical protein